MRKRRKGYWNGHGQHVSINANTINVTNVTNVTNITQVSQASGHGWHKKNRNRRNGDEGSRERKPRLLRFCASGGLLDQDVAERMSDSEMFDGFTEVGSYALKGLGKTASAWADDMGKSAKRFTRGVCGLLGRLFD